MLNGTSELNGSASNERCSRQRTLQRALWAKCAISNEGREMIAKVRLVLGIPK